MSTTIDRGWRSSDFCLQLPQQQHSSITRQFAETVHSKVCRTNFEAPGFCLIDLGPACSSEALRRSMVDLKTHLSEIESSLHGRRLIHVSFGRFDQQTTTRPHRDGGPDASLLMLGYEPSGIEARLSFHDYSRCASDLGLSPQEFLDRHNPMFGDGELLLESYASHLNCFSHSTAQIVLVNNSCLPSGGNNWQGVLHTAEVLNPHDELRRVVNSTMLAIVSEGTEETIPHADRESFLTTSIVRRRGYSRRNLEDDGDNGGKP